MNKLSQLLRGVALTPSMGRSSSRIGNVKVTAARQQWLKDHLEGGGTVASAVNCYNHNMAVSPADEIKAHNKAIDDAKKAKRVR